MSSTWKLFLHFQKQADYNKNHQVQIQGVGMYGCLDAKL